MLFLVSRTINNWFINDLITTISSIETGIRTDDDSVIAILAYADDVVLLAESENDFKTYLMFWNLGVMLIKWLLIWINPW